MKEIWKHIEGFDDRYEISNLGRIRSWYNSRENKMDKPIIRRPQKSHNGYLFLRLAKGGKTYNRRVSRLVLEAFIGLPPSKEYQASHIDGDKSNNNLSNLCWETPSENQNRRRQHGTMNFGENHPMSKLTDKDILKIRKLSSSHTYQQLANMFNTVPGNIDFIVKRKTWTHI